MQNNIVACTVNEADGTAFDVDWGNHNTTIQYNYSRNNLGGFLMMMPRIGNWPQEPRATLPSDGTVVRYNVSEDDTSSSSCPIATTVNKAHNVFEFVTSIPNRSGSAAPFPDFYNNTIYISSGRATSVVGTRSGNSQPGSYMFRNNLVLNFGSKGYLSTTGSVFANNLLYGPRNSNEPTTGTIYLSPQLVGPLQSATQASAGAAAYQPRESSPALGAGVPIPSNGGRDFAGKPIAAVPSIGAYENGATNLVRNAGFDSGALAPWTLSGAGSSITTSTWFNGTSAVQTGNANSGVDNLVSGLTPSTTYLLSAWVKVGNVGEQLAIGVKNYGGTETYSKSTDST